MEPVHGKCKASEFAEGDVISSMPKNVITNILDRLPLQDAVKTGILSSNWRFNYTMLSQLVFDDKFFQYQLRTKGERLFYRRNLSRFLLHLKSHITKFVLCIPEKEHGVLDIDDINHWILFLSTKGMKEFTLINMQETPLKLPVHFFTCLELEHLKLYNCCFHPSPRFCGFPNLLSFDFHQVIFKSCSFGEFVTQCPLLETLKANDRDGTAAKVKPIEILKLENLKILSMPLCNFDNRVITTSGIIQLLGFLPKLEEVELDFRLCKFFAEAGARRRVPAALGCFKILTLKGIDFSSCSMVLCASDLVRASPNLQSLKVMATCLDQVSHLPSFLKVDCGTMGQLQLRIVELTSIRGSEDELKFYKVLASLFSLAKEDGYFLQKSRSGSWVL